MQLSRARPTEAVFFQQCRVNMASAFYCSANVFAYFFRHLSLGNLDFTMPTHVFFTHPCLVSNKLGSLVHLELMATQSGHRCIQFESNYASDARKLSAIPSICTSANTRLRKSLVSRIYSLRKKSALLSQQAKCQEALRECRRPYHVLDTPHATSRPTKPEC